MSLMKHLIFIYDMTEQDFSLWITVKVFLSSKKPSPSHQCKLGASKIQTQPRILETHKEKQGLLDLGLLLVWTPSSAFSFLFADIFL